MPDMEKVIKGLECCGRNIDDCEFCPYNYDGDEGENKCLRDQLIPDALALLKEQEHKDKMFQALEDDWKRLKELLKEQEAIIEQYHKADGFLFVHGWKWK